MKNKFAFDLPRLKIGVSKVEAKPPKEIPIGFDSPPPTPKSVRPPLPPRTDYELRTACALVLQNYKPSDVVYEEQYGDLQEVPQDVQEELEYEVVRSAVERELESPLQPVNTANTRSARQRTMSGELISERYSRERRATLERSPQSEDSRQARPQRRSLLERAEELRSRLQLERAASPTEDELEQSTNPFMVDDVVDGHDAAERSGPDLRSDSMMTEGVTPQTEDEEYTWTGSTAPTTAGITPARNSNRTSNIIPPGPANDSTAKFLASDTEWMRQELEKHKKAQEEANAPQDLEEQPSTGVTEGQTGETKDTPVVQAPPVPPIPARKPVPKPSAEILHSRTDGTPSSGLSRSGSKLSRSGSKKLRSTPRSESIAEMGLLRPESRQANDDLDPQTEAIPIYNVTASHSFHRQPLSGIAAPYASHNVSQPGSRPRSITRQIREFIRPSSRTQSREASRPESRARSVESLASSVDSASKWRKWKPFNRNRDSAGSDDFGRPGSGDENRRGRTFSQDTPTSPQSKRKVNLNRELPPLPSLDQWNDGDVASDPQETNEHVASMIQRNPSNGRSIASPAISRSQKPSVDSTTSQQPRDSVLIDNTIRIHPKRISSLGAQTDLSQYPFTEPVSASLPQSPALEQTRDLRQSQSVQQLPTELSERMNNASIPDGFERPAVPPKDRVINYSRATPTNVNIGRTMSQRIPVATRRSGTSNTEQHTRTISDQQLNFSRKLSSEDYSRMHDMRYRNVTGTPPRKPVPGVVKPVIPEQTEKPKKKWWQGAKLKKNRQSWMTLGNGS